MEIFEGQKEFFKTLVLKSDLKDKKLLKEIEKHQGFIYQDTVFFGANEHNHLFDFNLRNFKIVRNFLLNDFKVKDFYKQATKVGLEKMNIFLTCGENPSMLVPFGASTQEGYIEVKVK